MGTFCSGYHIVGRRGIACAKKKVRRHHLLGRCEAVEDNKWGEGKAVVLKVGEVNEEPR